MSRSRHLRPYAGGEVPQARLALRNPGSHAVCMAGRSLSSAEDNMLLFGRLPVHCGAALGAKIEAHVETAISFAAVDLAHAVNQWHR